VLQLAELFHLVEPCAQIEGIHCGRWYPEGSFA